MAPISSDSSSVHASPNPACRSPTRSRLYTLLAESMVAKKVPPPVPAGGGKNAYVQDMVDEPRETQIISLMSQIPHVRENRNAHGYKQQSGFRPTLRTTTLHSSFFLSFSLPLSVNYLAHGQYSAGAAMCTGHRGRRAREPVCYYNTAGTIGANGQQLSQRCDSGGGAYMP